MPTEIKKVMEKKDNGITEQIYPETHANAVIGLLELLQKNGGISSGGSLPSGSGGISITDIPLADLSQSGLMSPELVKQLNDLGEEVSSFSIAIGSVETAESQTGASVTISGVFPDVILDFVLPRGEPGEKGDTALTISIGKVIPVDSPEESKVINVGTAEELILDFYLPKGPKGDDGNSVVPLATEDKEGLMSSDDKVLLNKLSNYKIEKVGEV